MQKTKTATKEITEENRDLKTARGGGLIETSPPYVVQDDYLVNTLGLPLSFIKNHAKAMGSFGRPRNYLYKNVVAYLEMIAEQAIEKSGSRQKKAAANAAMVEELFRETVALHDFQNNRGKVFDISAKKKQKAR